MDVTRFVTMLAALALVPRLFGFLSGRNTMRIKYRVRRQWGRGEVALIVVAALTLWVLGSCGVLK